MRKILLLIGITFTTLGILILMLLIEEMYHLSKNPEDFIAFGYYVWLIYFISLTLIGIMGLVAWYKKLEAKHGKKIIILAIIIIDISPIVFLLGFIPG